MNESGEILRQMPSMSKDLASTYGDIVLALTMKARGLVRDIDPQNELQYMRIRAGSRGAESVGTEIMVAPGNFYLVFFFLFLLFIAIFILG